MSPPRMPDRSPSAVTMAFLGRSVLSLRRNQVVSMDQYHEEELQDLDLFQSFVADRLLYLLSPPPLQTEKPPSAADHDHILSFSFLQRLLDVFISCEDQFKTLLARNSGLFAKPPGGGDRLLADLLDRAVKSLDVCNAVRQNLHSLRHWNRNADIAASAIIPITRAETPLIGEGRLKRAKKALANLLALSEANNQVLQEPSAGRKPERAWSFRCKAASASGRPEESSLLQQPYSKSWSGLKQVQAMSASLAAPRAAGDAGGGFAVAVYTMSSVLVFAMWALVAAIPCQERSTASLVPTPVAPPKQLAWSAAMYSLQERIAEELRRRGRRDGILVEFLRVEKCGKELMELARGGGGTEAVVAKARELAKASGRLGEGLGPFERQVSEVFHRLADSRGEVMKFLEQSTSPPFLVL